MRDLNGRIDAVLDGGRCPVGIESTVLALEGEPRLLRAGAISRAQIEELIGPVSDAPAMHGVAQSPGQQRRHYAPAALVRLAAAPELSTVIARLSGPVGAVLRGDTAAPKAAAVSRLPSDPAGYARELYAALRDLEDAGCTTIVVEQIPGGAEWDAIRDRVTRASGT